MALTIKVPNIHLLASFPADYLSTAPTGKKLGNLLIVNSL